MKKISIAVSNSEPLIHLSQIESFDVLNIVKNIYITQEVFDEICSFNLPGNREVRKSKLIEAKNLKDKSKDLSKLISEKYSLDLGESTSIALAKQEKIRLFLTDDLSARIIAKEFRLEVHGTIGIILRAFRLSLITEKRTIGLIQDLHKKSSIFITTDLVNYVTKEIRKFSSNAVLPKVFQNK